MIKSLCILCIVVHCRIGSLEIEKIDMKQIDKVHCRIGSLESFMKSISITQIVHCCIGSLEK